MQHRMQGFLMELWQGVQPGLMKNRNQDWKAAGNQVRALPPPPTIGSKNLLKSPLFTNQLAWVLYIYSKGWSSYGPQVNLMALPATHKYWLVVSDSQFQIPRKVTLIDPIWVKCPPLVQSTLPRGAGLHHINMAAEGSSPRIMGAVIRQQGLL